MGEFPVEPEMYFPGIKQEVNLGIESEVELVNLVGVKCGIHLQALTRDLNRLITLVEGPVIRPYRKQNSMSLADILSDLDKIDLQIKNLLSNLFEDQKGRGVMLNQLLHQEEEDQLRELEALRKSGIDRGVVKERVLVPKQRQSTMDIPHPPSPVETELQTSTPNLPSEKSPRMEEEEDIFDTEPTLSKQEETIPTLAPNLKSMELNEPIEESIPEAPSLPTNLQTEDQDLETKDLTEQEIPLEEDTTNAVEEDTHFQPSFDVKETPESLCVTSNISGLNRDDIHLDVGTDSFTIEGFRKPLEDEEGLSGGLSGEQNLDKKFGAFSETFKIPNDVDSNLINASYEGGVLRIDCPKKDTHTEAAF